MITQTTKVKGQRSSSQRSKTNFATNWAFPDHNYSLNLQMATKLCTKLEIAKKRRHVVFRGHPPNFKVTRYKKTSSFEPNRAFADCTSSLNLPTAKICCIKLKDALKRCPIVFQGHPPHFKVTRDKKCRFWHESGFSAPRLHFQFTDGNEMTHKAWSSIEKVLYYFSRSSIKFQGQTGQKNGDFDPNWVFPDCDSSLNSPMAVKWCSKLEEA